MNVFPFKNKIISREKEFSLIAVEKINMLLKYIGFNIKKIFWFEKKVSHFCFAKIKRIKSMFLNEINLEELEKLHSCVKYEIKFSKDEKLKKLWFNYENYFYLMETFLCKHLHSGDL